MNIIETKAPIALEDLKVYFQDKNILYRIDYENSEIKEEKLFIYLSNLDLPCDLVIKESESFLKLMKTYLNFTHILNIPILEKMAISLLLQVKNIISDKIWPDEFILENKEIIEEWISKLESLSLYNMWIIDSEECREFVKSHPEKETNSLIGINFVSLLKHTDFYIFYNNVEKENLSYYSAYFNDYMFKGQNLYYYWANENNPMFVLTWGIATGEINPENYVENILKDSEEV